MYPREKMEEISTSFCFICLLHLANERGLKLEVGLDGTLEGNDDLGMGSDKRVGELASLNVSSMVSSMTLIINGFTGLPRCACNTSRLINTVCALYSLTFCFVPQAAVHWLTIFEARDLVFLHVKFINPTISHHQLYKRNLWLARVMKRLCGWSEITKGRSFIS
jgi:hypothetical protein